MATLYRRKPASNKHAAFCQKEMYQNIILAIFTSQLSTISYYSVQAYNFTETRIICVLAFNCYHPLLVLFY